MHQKGKKNSDKYSVCMCVLYFALLALLFLLFVLLYANKRVHLRNILYISNF